MKPFVETIEDLKVNREEIIDDIKEYTTDVNMIKRVMKQIVEIVTASNYEEMDINIYETVEMAYNDVSRMSDTPVVDNSEMYAKARMAQRPSSMR